MGIADWALQAGYNRWDHGQTIKSQSMTQPTARSCMGSSSTNIHQLHYLMVYVLGILVDRPWQSIVLTCYRFHVFILRRRCRIGRAASQSADLLGQWYVLFPSPGLAELDNRALRLHRTLNATLIPSYQMHHSVVARSASSLPCKAATCSTC